MQLLVQKGALMFFREFETVMCPHSSFNSHGEYNLSFAFIKKFNKLYPSSIEILTVMKSSVSVQEEYAHYLEKQQILKEV